jgi:methoxymalonate biosynthesis acyl carrier protein
MTEPTGDRTVNTDRITRAVREFIMASGRLEHLADDEDIFCAGIFSSLFAMQLVVFVESEFAIEVLSEDLDIANFSSVNAITHLVARKNAVGVQHA